MVMVGSGCVQADIDLRTYVHACGNKAVTKTLVGFVFKEAGRSDHICTLNA